MILGDCHCSIFNCTVVCVWRGHEVDGSLALSGLRLHDRRCESPGRTPSPQTIIFFSKEKQKNPYHYLVRSSKIGWRRFAGETGETASMAEASAQVGGGSPTHNLSDDQVAGSVADPILFPDEDWDAAAFELLLEEDLEAFLLLAEDHRDC